MLAILEETFASKNQMNVITAGKTPEPRWLTHQQAREALEDGLSVWDFASDKNPHIVLVGIGDYMTKEALAAIELIKTDAPEINIRFVNVLRLQSKSELNSEQQQPQIPNAEKYFTVDKPVIVNFHGYPEAIKGILFDIKNPQRFSVHGYLEEGSTTTPFDLLVRNHVDRYHLALEILETMVREGVIDETKQQVLTVKYQQALTDHHDYILRVGADPLEIENWQWSGRRPVIVDRAKQQHVDILKNAHTIAFIGLSDNPERHSHRVARYFQKQGYRIIPINPTIEETLGEKAYASLLDIPLSLHIDIVDIFRKPSEVLKHMQEIMERGGIRTIWLAEGANSHAAEDFAEDYGLYMVTNQCIMDVDISENENRQLNSTKAKTRNRQRPEAGDR
jgi:predicted CoA-binding protein